MESNEYSLLSNSNNMENDSIENRNTKDLQSSNNSSEYNPYKRSKNELEININNLENEINLSNCINLSSSENVNPNSNPRIQILTEQFKVRDNSEFNKKCIPIEKSIKKNEEIQKNENENKSPIISYDELYNNYNILKNEIESLKIKIAQLEKIIINHIKNDEQKSNSEFNNKTLTGSNGNKKNNSIFSQLI